MSTRTKAPTIKSLTNKVKELEDANYRLVGLNAKLRWPDTTPLTMFTVTYCTEAKVKREIDARVIATMSGSSTHKATATIDDAIEITKQFTVLATSPGEALNAGYAVFIAFATEKLNAMNVRPGGTSTITGRVEEAKGFIGQAESDGALSKVTRKDVPAGL